MNLYSIFNKYNKTIGEISGDTFDIYRPDYNQEDNTPVLVQSNIKYRVEASGTPYAEPKFPGVAYYDVFGNRSLVQPGDILIKSVSDGITPPVTIESIMPIKALVGFRSSRTCDITNEYGDVVYSNVYYDVLGPEFPGSSLNENLELSLKIPGNKVVLYKRLNINKPRMHLIETDDNTTETLPDGSVVNVQIKWSIESFTFSGNLMILSIRGVE